MAHLNTAGVHVPIWLDSSASAIGWGKSSSYPFQEGTFWGNILITGNMNHGATQAPVGYYCDGDGFAQGSSGVVAGRIGAGQGSVPYSNPYGNGALCKNNCTGEWPNGMYDSQGHLINPDGYKACTGFNTMITVWRNNTYTPTFDSGYVYELQPKPANGGETLDVYNGQTSNGTPVQQYSNWNGDPQKFRILQSGSNWKIAMKTNSNKCVDLAGGTGNGTQLVINDCNGSAGQAWSITPDVQTGAFTLKNASAGRCLDETGWNTSNGVRIQIWDCNGLDAQKWFIKAAQ
jgi:hypothetical protein